MLNKLLLALCCIAQVCGAFAQSKPVLPATGIYVSPQFKPSELKTYMNVIYSRRPNYQGIEYSQKPTNKAKQVVIDSGLKEIALKMDIALPPNASSSHKQPLIILIHGGAYHTGSKPERWKETLSYASAGYISATINYRLLPVSTMRDSKLWDLAIAHGVEDLQNAIRYLKANAEKYHIDTTRIATIGTSAGAIHSIINATAYDVLPGAVSDFPKISAKVSAAIGTGGEFIGKQRGLNPLIRFNKNNVPMLFFHANPNDSGPAKATWQDNALPLQKAAQQAGAEFILVAQPDHTHTVDISLDKSLYWDTDLKPFLWDKLKLKSIFQ
jgi:hypothetical protein